MAKWINIAGIEKALCEAMKTVSGNVFVNNVPNGVADAMNDFVCVSVGNAVQDRNAYKESYVTIYLGVRNKKSNVEDSMRIDELANKIMSLLPMATDYFSLTSPDITFGSRQVDFTVTTIRCDLLIK